MKFGIKTVPQHTTWREMLDVWRAADDRVVTPAAPTAQAGWPPPV